MNANNVSTRRGFFWKAGAVLSAPVTAAAVSHATDLGTGDSTRLALLENVNAIRDLHETYARLLNLGAHAEMAALFLDPGEMQLDDTVRRVSADRFGGQNDVEIAVDGNAATARSHCTVEIETMIESVCTLVDMARAQGEGLLRRPETRVLEGRYVKRDGRWMIARTAWQTVADVD